MKLRARTVTAIATLSFVGLAATTAVALWPDPQGTPRAKATDFYLDAMYGDEVWLSLPRAAHPNPEGELDDDPRQRMVHIWSRLGRPSFEARDHLLKVARSEAQRWAHLMPGAQSAISPTAIGPTAIATFGDTWISLGPTDADFEFNGNVYFEVDSGRVSGLAVDPANPDIVYLSASGGGVWKTTNFSSTDGTGRGNPTWTPIAEEIVNQAVGAMTMDPSNPLVLYLGTGDAFDREGGHVIKTTDGGDSWQVPVPLSVQHPGKPKLQGVGSVRDIKVDPLNPNVVMVATNLGLFRSTDAGSSFSRVDLPNGNDTLMEAMWSVVHLGPNRWAASGVSACYAGHLPPNAGWGTTAGEDIPGEPGTPCTLGNPGDVWVSTDNGVTWTSRRLANGLPARVGRITLGAGSPAGGGASTVVYAQVTGEAEGPQVGTWRSTDGGNTFVNALGSLSNPNVDCPNARFAEGGAQGWYNNAVAVSPLDSNHVVMGGTFCGGRTRNGLAGAPSWTNVGHWLPVSGRGTSQEGTLPYVHADWHRALVVALPGGGVRTLIGTDGGIAYSDNLFAISTGAGVVWRDANRGLATHLFYGLASGDAAAGNPFVVIGGMQDNGTRLRSDPARPTMYNQVLGGDGSDMAIARTNTGRTTYYGSATGTRRACNAHGNNGFCSEGGDWAEFSVRPQACPSDDDPFFPTYEPITGSRQGHVITFTRRTVHKTKGDPTGGVFAAASPCFTSTDADGRDHLIRNISTAQVQDGLLAAALSGGRFAVSSNCQDDQLACTWTISKKLKFDLNGDGTVGPDEQVLYANDVAFPPGPTGKPLGDVYVAVSGAPETEAETPVPAAIGHVFITTDRGTTFTPINGVGTGALPNVPATMVRFDPSDLTNQTIIVATDLGVYRTTDGGTNWVRYGAGLPMVQITTLQISRSGGQIRVGTYGRGAWEINPGAATRLGANGDFDRNGQIDFFDMAAMASRLGKTPSNPAPPLYDWNLNLGAATTELDDADLAALTAKVAEQP